VHDIAHRRQPQLSSLHGCTMKWVREVNCHRRWFRGSEWGDKRYYAWASMRTLGYTEYSLRSVGFRLYMGAVYLEGK